MNIVVLQKCRGEGDIGQQERHEGYFLLSRQIAENQGELFGVVRAVVGRHPHPQQQDLRPGRAA
jgi:hypothetical protein